MGCRNIDWDTDNCNLGDLQVPFGTCHMLSVELKSPGPDFDFVHTDENQE